MDCAQRLSFADLSRGSIPDLPGVYALYRNGERAYVGTASSLRKRVWGNHAGRGASMTGSAMRKNVAEHLGIASAADIKTGRFKTTREHADSVTVWLRGCEIAWIVCESPDEARDLEGSLKHEFKPWMTKL